MALRTTAFALGGGLSLGAYQAGALAAFERSGLLDVQAVAGASIGAMNGAVFAGNAPEQRVERLRTFWKRLETEAVPTDYVDPLGFGSTGTLRHLRNWSNVAATHLVGANGLFRPRLPGMGESAIPSLYDLGEARRTLPALVDFDRLNAGTPRYLAAATDIEQGEIVLFDTLGGERIAVEHLVASGALLPSFEPVRIGGRLLADGGLAGNVPLEPLLASDRKATAPLCIVIDLFAPDAPAPTGLESAGERANDAKFAMQTVMRLNGLVRERALEARLGNDGGTELVYLSYRPAEHEAGSEKTWDFSPATIRDRWAAGEADAAAALEIIASLADRPDPGLRVHQIRRA